MNIIYKTTNLITGKIYVGKHIATNLDDEYLGSGTAIIKSIKKYGKINFVREILEVVEEEFLLNEREVFWINKLDSKNKTIGYNISIGGDGNSSETFKEILNRPEVKEKKSIAQKLNWSNLEYREKQLKFITTDKVKLKQSQTRKRLNDVMTDEDLISRNKKIKLSFKNPMIKNKTLESNIKSHTTSQFRDKISKLKMGNKNRIQFIYKLINRFGEVFETNNLTQFCKDNGLDVRNMCNVVNGKNKSCKGWKCKSKTKIKGVFDEI